MKNENKDSKDATASDTKSIVMHTLYLGNYGYPPNLPPVKIDVRASNFITTKLDQWVRQNNVIGWSEQKLQVIAKMLDDRNEIHLANEIRNIQEKLKCA